TIFAALVIAIICAPTASAQATAAAITIISGNGQMPCPTCDRTNYREFYPLVVKVTDSSGAPIAGKTVNWQITFATGATPFIDPSSVTNSNGIAYAHYFQGFQAGVFGTAYLQSTVLATADGVSTTFYETQALTSNSAGGTNLQLVASRLDSPTDGDLGKSLGTGPAGSSGPVPVRVHVDSGGVGVPNISVRLLNDDPTSKPSAVCATQPGADPGSVLTDANGDATCTPVFGPIPNNSGLPFSTVSVLVGGVDPVEFDQTLVDKPLPTALAFAQYAGIRFVVTPVTAGLVKISSGNNQVLNPGQASSPLVVQVTDATGAVSVSNASVTWSVSPAAGATLSTTSSTTNSSGLAQTTLTLSPAASGQYSVKAALTASPSIFTTFLVSTNVQVSSLAKVVGDTQTAPANQTFGSPLVVQVNGNNGQPLSGVSVGFTITGPGSLSASSAVTDGSGRAQVTVKAGASAGAISVVASVGNVSQTFTLTVVPPGPTLTSGSFVNAGGLGSAISPCSLVTAIAGGLAAGLNGLVLQSNSFGPWATTLAGDTVTVNNVAAPIYSVGTVNGVEQITFQLPCETPTGNATVAINVSGGTASATVSVTGAAPGIFETVMSDNVKRAVAIRPDGTFISLANPARKGEVVRVLVTGMGPTTPTVGTGALPVPGSDALVGGQVIVGVNNAGARVVTSRLSPNLIGVYEVAFQVPSDAPAGNDIVLSVAVNAPGDGQTRFSNGSKIPIQ
ncbi:MAG: Ig domain protein group 1 domain protein, partial [Candidatus Solibacter sp.]|nr:Ig domain protein group 1 domain protein [Candidatus Solibacter sp.]